MKIKPIQDRVIVKRLEEAAMTKGGLYIPETAKEKPNQGEVVAVGEGRELKDGGFRQLDVKVGDRILFSRYGVTELKIDDVDYLVVREADILGVVGDADARE